MTDNAATFTFETGYQRLKAVEERVTSTDVPVSEMVELFAEGKSLEHALTHYLDTQRARIDQIAAGEGLRPYTIVSHNHQSQQHQ